jgi:uncharacterized membrane protein YbhN (UPF0104 family)
MGLRLLFTAAAVGLLLQSADPGESAHELASAPRWVWLAPGLALLINSLLHAERSRVLLQAAGVHLPFHRVLGAFLRSLFLALVLPRGAGDLAKAAWLTRDTGRLEVVLSVMVVARLLEALPWLALLLWGIGSGALHPWPGLEWGARATAAVLLAALFSAGALLRGGDALVERLPLLREPAARGLEAARLMTAHPGAMLRAGLLAVPVALLNVASVDLVLRAYGVIWSPWDALVRVPAMDALMSLPITVAGLGLREGVFAYVLEAEGIRPARAAAIGLTRWSGELVRAAIGGVWFLLGDRMSSAARS